MIKHKLLLICFLIVASVFVPSVTEAQRITIAIGDRPYYRGYSYWHNDYEMIWVPGHWSRNRRHWIRGHYRRGVHRSHWRGNRRRYRDRDRDRDTPHERVRDRIRDRF